MIRNKFFVNQTSDNDCGAACLTMILRLNNIKVNLKEVKNKLTIKDDGISAYDIINLAKKYNLDANGYKNMELDDANSAFIAHIIKDKLQHFVVVLKVLKDKVLIADPASDIIYVDKKDFEKVYTKIALVFQKNNNLYKDILKNNKKLIFKILILTLLFTLFCIIYSYMFSYVLTININKKVKIILLIILLVFGFLKDIINYVRVKISFKLQIIIDKGLTTSIINKIIDLPDSYYQNNSVGSLIARINDLSYIKEMISNMLSNLFISFFLITTVSIVLLIFDYNIFILNILFLIIVFLINKIFLKYSFYNSYDLQIKNENINKYITECLTLIDIIKNLSKENYFKQKIEYRYDKYINKYNKVFNFYNKKNLIITLLFTFYLIFLCFYLIINNISLANLIFVYNLENIIIDSLNNIFNLSFLYSNFKSISERISEIYNYNIINNNERIDIKNIIFNNVYFKYNKKLILNNFSLIINKGDFIMINGKSGIGKTTIFKILLKKINYNGNNILINGIKLKNIDIKQIKENIIYIDQKIKLFNDTIKENIFMGNKYDQKLLEIINLNNEELINNEIDNMNSNLSSGQISKVAIAQALLSDKKIIILDEVTSTLDPKEERMILHKIKTNFNKTIIIITHRKSNIDLFNKVITIK